MEANDLQGMVSLDPRGMVGIIVSLCQLFIPKFAPLIGKDLCRIPLNIAKVCLFV